MISLDPNSKANILGLAVVVHSGKDDLGKGGDTGSLKTGNAGSRVACGIIKAQWRQLTNLVITNQIINNVWNLNEFYNILPLSGILAYMFLISELFDCLNFIPVWIRYNVSFKMTQFCKNISLTWWLSTVLLGSTKS